MTVDSRDELPWSEAKIRMTLVYRDGAPACGSKGPQYATCVRSPGHLGALCEGNGFDEWGPRWHAWANRRAT